MKKEQSKNKEAGLKWLFFDLNSYFASVEQQERKELRGKPVAVVPMNTDSTCAIAASYEAKAYGVKTGTMIYEAKKMCPDLICVEARHELKCSIDEAAFLLIGREREQENAIKLADNIKQGIWDNVGRAINCSIGIAPNVFLAKIASDMQKPNGLTLLTDENLPERLFDLRLTDLPGINVNMERRLHKAGIYSVEKFYHLAPKQARSIWGSVNGERFWYSLHGYDLPIQETKKRW
jgi:DNA polymerase-4